MWMRQLRLLAVILPWAAVNAAHAAPSADFTLHNGLRILVRERSNVPLVAIELWVRAGAREESPEEYGAAHFLEHTLFKGTRTRGVGEADIAVENLGATLNASTGPDYARFYTTVASAHAGDALTVLADVVRNATLPPREVERERQVIRDELAQRDADPEAALIDRLYAAAFRGRTYARSPGGTESAIRLRTQESLTNFYRRTYTPARCALVLVGDITPERARQIGEKAFGDWPASKSSAEDATWPGTGIVSSRPHDPGSAGSKSDDIETPVPDAVEPDLRQIVETADISQPIVGLAYRAPESAAPNSACCAQIAAAMLGRSNFGGRLDIGPLANCSARVSYVPRLDRSLFVVSSLVPLIPGRASTRAEQAAAVSAQERAMISVLNNMISTPPTLGELTAAKNALLGRATFDNETDTGTALSLGYALVTGGQTREEWRACINRVTLAEVRQFIAAWLAPTHCISAIILPAPYQSGSHL